LHKDPILQQQQQGIVVGVLMQDAAAAHMPYLLPLPLL
jgi:hypothetical protein